MDLIIQQRQAFESFVSADREQLHLHAERFSKSESVSMEGVHENLQMIQDVDSIYSVICLDEGWACSNAYPAAGSGMTIPVFLPASQCKEIEAKELEYVSPNIERVLGLTPGELVNKFQAADMAADAEGTIAYYTEVRALHPGEMAKPRSTAHINYKTGEHKYFWESTYCLDIQGRKIRVSYLSNRTRERKTQIIAMTANAFVDDVREALESGMDAHIAKPVQIDNLKTTIQQVLDKRPEQIDG